MSIHKLSSLLISLCFVSPLSSAQFISLDYNGTPLIKHGLVLTSSPASNTLIKAASAPSLEGYLNRSTFGTNGTGTTFIPSTLAGGVFDQINAITVAPNGIIIVAGITRTKTVSRYFAVAQFLPNGQLDLTFGGGATGARPGTQYLPFNIATGATDDEANAVALTPQGNIVVAGFSRTGGGQAYFALAQFTSNGQLDTSFGGFTGAHPGTQYIPFSIAGGGTDDEAYALAITATGNIILGGWSTGGAMGNPTYFALAQFLSNGTLDTSFGQTHTSQAGTQYVSFSIAGGATFDQAHALALTPAGNIVLGGWSTSGVMGNPTYFALAQFLSNGTLDTSFGQTGTKAGTQYLNFTIAGGTQDQVYALALTPAENIILGGFSRTGGGGQAYFAIAQFLSNGQPDTSFGGFTGARSGTQYVNFSCAGNGGTVDIGYGLALTHEGNITLGGFSQSGLAGNPNYFSLAQFLPNGKLNPNFGQVSTSRAGTQYVPFSIAGGPATDQAYALALTPNGNITLGGYSTAANGVSSFALAQFVP